MPFITKILLYINRKVSVENSIAHVYHPSLINKDNFLQYMYTELLTILSDH